MESEGTDFTHAGIDIDLNFIVKNTTKNVYYEQFQTAYVYNGL